MGGWTSKVGDFFKEAFLPHGALSTFAKRWVMFPYPVVALVAIFVLGLFFGAWNWGTVLFWTIPLYYLVGHAWERHAGDIFLVGACPLVICALFCYLAFVQGQGAWAWLLFFAIPVLEVMLLQWAVKARYQAFVDQVMPVDVDPIGSSTARSSSQASTGPVYVDARFSPSSYSAARPSGSASAEEPVEVEVVSVETLPRTDR